MRVLDLFAGIGGFSLAAHWMGWETVAFCERDPFCQKVLRKNFGQDIEIHDDITTFSGKPFRGRIDVVTGGFPCQPFSAAGKREGVSDERYLFPESLRIVREVQPAWFVLENVNGLLSMANETWDTKVASQFYTQTPDLHDYQAILSRTEIMLLHCICEEIEREGYAVQPVVIPASSVGAWHERKRIWIVANSRREYGAGRPNESQSNGAVSAGNAFKPKRSVKGNGVRIDTVTSGIGRHDRQHHRQERYIPSDLGLAAEGESERQGRLGRFGAIVADVADAPSGRFKKLRADRQQSPGDTYDSDRWERQHWYEAATAFCGMADGVPGRVDRLRALGNSIVPQIAYEIFKAIEAVETQ